MEFVYETLRIFASTAMNGENLIKPPVTNKLTLMMLPNDLLLNCLARVSRLYYPTLSLVSKSFRSLLASLELYQTRTLLNRTENSLYVCLHFNYSPRWFILSQKPTQISDLNPKPRWYSLYINELYRFLKNCFRNKEKKLRGNIFVSVPTRSSPYVGWNILVTIGYNIYNIERFSSDVPSKVMIMDCRSHTWHEAPSMQMAREFPIVNVLDGKIYVVGGNEDCDSSNWMEVFDPKTQVWQYVQSPDTVIHDNRMCESLAIEGKLYLIGQKSVVYKPSINRWDELNLKDSIYLRYGLNWGSCCCVIDNIYYCLTRSEMLEWYDLEGGRWRVLTGLEKLPKLPIDFNCLRLVNYDGYIAVLWEKKVGDEKEIWYADISLERRSKQEIRGKIERCDVMFIVPKSCQFLHFLSVMV